MIVEIESSSKDRKIYFEVEEAQSQQEFKQGLVEAGAKENIKNKNPQNPKNTTSPTSPHKRSLLGRIHQLPTPTP